MADGGDILPEAVRFVLNGWSVLQIAVQHGFGGLESAEKAEWMIDVVGQFLRDNGDIERYDLEDYIEEILNNEFDTIVEDGSLPKVSQTLCNFHRLWKEGRIADIEREISTAPKHKLCTPLVNGKETTDTDDDEDDNCDNTQKPSLTSDVTRELDQLHIQQNCSEAEANVTSSGAPSPHRNSNSHTAMDEDEEGWEVVRRSKRR